MIACAVVSDIKIPFFAFICSKDRISLKYAGTDRSIKEIEHILDNKIEELKKKIAKVISDTPDVYYQAQKAEYTYNTPQTAMEHLKKAIQKDFPALDESIGYELKYVDASLEESMSPAFYLTPAIDDYKNNVIYINRNKRYDLSKAFTTIGHEGYPGHLYQTCYFQSKIRHRFAV